MNAVVDACKSGKLQAQPAVVISNNSGCRALERARKQSIPAYHLSRAICGSDETLDEQIAATLAQHDCGLVLLAGYMRKLGPKTLARFHHRVINIHPALLPKFGGDGMYGGHVHEAVLDADEETTGVTIHVVDGEYDSGSILAQREVPVEAGDTPDSLAQRLLPMEHAFLVETLQRIVAGDLVLPIE